MNKHQVEMLGNLGSTAQLNSPLAKILNKYLLFVHPDDKSLTPCLLRDGYWESWVTAWVINNVKPDTVFFDVGAHCGYYTMIAADLVGPRGTVYAFEPNPYLAQLIVDSAEANKFTNVRVWPKALGTQYGSTTLYLPRYLTGSASTAHKIDDRYETRRLRVAVEPMGEFVRFFKSVVPMVIKIDAEGAEENIINSALVQLSFYDDVTFVLEYTPGSYTPEFLPNLRRFGDVTLLTTESTERQVSDDWLKSQKDWVTLIVRHRL